VGVREENEVQFADVEIQRIAILAVGLAAALKHAAIDQELARGREDVKARSRDFSGGAEKAYLHVLRILLVSALARAGCETAANPFLRFRCEEFVRAAVLRP